MGTTSSINRHADGSIDVDFYRARAKALRAQAIRDARTLRWGIVVLGGLGLAGLAASVPNEGMRVAMKDAMPGRPAQLSCPAPASSGLRSVHC